jgi:hypothetical protein
MQSELITRGMRPEPIPGASFDGVPLPPIADVPIIVPHMHGPVVRGAGDLVELALARARARRRPASPFDQLLPT